MRRFVFGGLFLIAVLLGVACGRKAATKDEEGGDEINRDEVQKLLEVWKSYDEDQSEKVIQTLVKQDDQELSEGEIRRELGNLKYQNVDVVVKRLIEDKPEGETGVKTARRRRGGWFRKLFGGLCIAVGVIFRIRF